MKIKLIVVSKTDIPYVQAGIDEYVGRLKHYCDFEIVVVPALKGTAKMPSAEVKEREGKLLLSKMSANDLNILLDEHGEEFSSIEFSRFIAKQSGAGIRSMAFVIGGAFGFSPEVYAIAGRRISFSKMTFNHQMIRLFFVEQLYRAHTILRGEKYHNE